MVYVLALNKDRGILFVWKCQAVSEARNIVRRLATLFGHCLHNIALSHTNRDNILHKQCYYSTVKNFTYENAKDWYLTR